MHTRKLLFLSLLGIAAALAQGNRGSITECNEHEECSHIQDEFCVDALYAIGRPRKNCSEAFSPFFSRPPMLREGGEQGQQEARQGFSNVGAAAAYQPPFDSCAPIARKVEGEF